MIKFDFSNIFRHIWIRAILENEDTRLEQLQKNLPVMIGNTLRRVGEKTKETITQRLEVTRGPKYRADRNIHHISDYIIVDGPFESVDGVGVGVVDFENLEKEVPYYLYQERGANIPDHLRYLKRGKYIVETRVKGSHIPARWFLKSGLSYLESDAEKDFETYMDEELNKI